MIHHVIIRNSTIVFTVVCESESMKRVASVLLLVLLFLVEVHCQQSYPYVSFMGETIANHSYVDISQVGTSSSNSIQCHTDLNTCCSSAQGPHRGHWIFPNGTTALFSRSVYERHRGQRVDLRRSSGTGPIGIYCCYIETHGAHGSVENNTVYVGLYTTDKGEIVHYLAIAKQHLHNDA